MLLQPNARKMRELSCQGARVLHKNAKMQLLYGNYAPHAAFYAVTQEILSPLRLPISPYQHIIRKELKTKKGLKKSLLNALKGAGMQFGGATRI